MFSYSDFAYGAAPSTPHLPILEHVVGACPPKRRDVSIITVKKIRDGLKMPLSRFFSGSVFSELEQEIV